MFMSAVHVRRIRSVCQATECRRRNTAATLLSAECYYTAPL